MTTTAHPIRPLAANQPINGPVSASASADGGLSLVNLAARQRMLSQRMILQTVLAAQGTAGKLEAAEKSLETFTQSQARLLATLQELDPASASHIRQTYHGTQGVGPQIEAFMVQMRSTLDCIRRQPQRAQAEVAALVERTDAILEALNCATSAFDQVGRSKSDALMGELRGIVEDIQTVAREAKVVSFNAQVIAARAGPQGREFAVVANVLSGITAEVDGLSRKALGLAVRSRT